MFMFHNSTRLFDYIVEEDWKSAVFQVNHAPKEARKWTNVNVPGDKSCETSFLPLHEVCGRTPPAEIVNALLSAYPKATREKDHFFKRTPLHIACIKKASPNVVQSLVRTYKESARVQDVLGRLPLHYAVYRHAPMEVINILLAAYPEGAQVRDFKDWIPIEIGCHHGASEEVLETLSTACDSADLDTSLCSFVTENNYSEEEIIDPVQKFRSTGDEEMHILKLQLQLLMSENSMLKSRTRELIVERDQFKAELEEIEKLNEEIIPVAVEHVRHQTESIFSHEHQKFDRHKLKDELEGKEKLEQIRHQTAKIFRHEQPEVLEKKQFMETINSQACARTTVRHPMAA